MRITGGTARGRKLTPLGGTNNRIRPTSDKARQAIFNILGDRVEGSRVLDLFAGTGALGIEALSRGADFAVFVDQAREAGEVIQQNLLHCFKSPRAFLFLQQLPSKSLHHTIDAKTSMRTRFDLIFLDPPYRKDLVLPTITSLIDADLIDSKAIVIVEEHHKTALPEIISNLSLIDSRKYGEAGIWLYSPEAEKL